MKVPKKCLVYIGTSYKNGWGYPKFTKPPCLESLFRFFCAKKYHLVGGLVAINLIFPYIGFLIIPIDFVIFFRGVALAHQPVYNGIRATWVAVQVTFNVLKPHAIAAIAAIAFGDGDDP